MITAAFYGQNDGKMILSEIGTPALVFPIAETCWLGAIISPELLLKVT